MDFFEHQDRSRKKSTRLILLFGLGVAGIVAALYLAVVVIFFYSEVGADGFRWFQPELFFVVSLVTLVVIFGGSMVKMHALRRGGSYVAESLGGREVDPATTDPRERVLVNVVEEMALASGIPVPAIYVLDEESGMNAFAAGYTCDDAVVAVTRGCLEQLNRDELQGVVAHEFSHILNGDMRLNIRLIGLISGILVLAVIGRILLHAGRGGGRNKGGGGVVILGLALLLIGYIGVFVSRLIQSAVSRQREYLSDASAVQFTRNPAGIAGALRKIGGFSAGTIVKSPVAAEAGHMFFGNPFFMSVFSTHPPLNERIRRIDASFAGEITPSSPGGGGLTGGISSLAGGPAAGLRQAPAPETIVGRVGTVPMENIAYGAEILAAVPEAVRRDLRDPFGASCVIYALLLDADAVEKKKQLAALQPLVSKEVMPRLIRLDKLVSGLPPELALPLLDLSIPSLRHLSPEQYQRFKEHARVLVEADGKISLFEFIIQQIITHRLEVAFHPRQEKEVYRSIEPLVDDAAVVISKLAVVGHDDPDEARQAFISAMKQIPGSGSYSDPRRLPEAPLQAVGLSLSRFASARPGVKRVLLDACAYCVLYDGTVTPSESELLRAVAYALDLPLPPLLTAS